MPQYVAWALPTPYHCNLQNNNLCGGLLVIVDLFVVIDDSVSSINKLAGAHERIVGKVGNDVHTLGGLLRIV